MTTNFSLRNANLARLMVIILYNDSFKQKRGDPSSELEEYLCVFEGVEGGGRRHTVRGGVRTERYQTAYVGNVSRTKVSLVLIS